MHDKHRQITTQTAMSVSVVSCRLRPTCLSRIISPCEGEEWTSGTPRNVSFATLEPLSALLPMAATVRSRVTTGHGSAAI
jgi:hypothetical protein